MSIDDLDITEAGSQPSPPRDVFYGTNGPRNARVMIVGEAWGRTEEDYEEPFVGEAGKELDRMLAEAGIARRDCFATNLVSKRPARNEMWGLFHPEPKRGEVAPALVRGLRPTSIVVEEIERLYRQIALVKPAIIVGAGNYPLWAMTNYTGVTKLKPYGKAGASYAVPSGIGSHRGSMHHALTSPFAPEAGYSHIPFLPIIHPAAILRNCESRAVTVHDLKRIPRAFKGDWRPAHNPVVLAPPSYAQAMSRFDFILRKANSGEQVPLACDIETVRRRLISCIGFSDDKNFAMAVPFVRLLPDRTFESYWTAEEEFNLVRKMQEILRHPNVLIVGQNFIYDTQYIQEWMGVTPRLDFDTMLAQHLVFPGTPKDLSYLSSLYCEYHWHWKDDNKDWDTTGTLEQHLLYNAMDNLRTFEIAEGQRQLIKDMELEELWEERKWVNGFCLRMMNRGVKINKEYRAKITLDIFNMAGMLENRLRSIIPVDLVDEVVEQMRGRKASPTPWYRSPDKQKLFFSEVLGMKIPKSRKTGEDTLGKEGLEDLRLQYPHYKKLFDLLSDIRSLGVFQSNFCAAPLEPNGRMKCSFNPAGTETFRLSSSENAFGRGTNLQNLPVGDDK